MQGGLQASDHYERAMKSLNDAHRTWAIVIHILTIVAVWPRWDAVAWVAGSMVVLTPINIWITLELLPARGAVFSEIVRGAFNIGLGLVVYHYTDWPVTVWLWLPYVALAFGSRGITFAILFSMWACMTIGGVLDGGVPWIYPLSAGAIAFLCRAFTAKRVAIAHEMFEESQKAHALLEQEMRARALAEIELRQAQKLEAMGRLASGVAHEINNPLQYVSSSVSFIEDGISILTSVHEDWRRLLWTAQPKLDPALLADLEKAERAHDLGGVRNDLDDSISLTREGVRRVSTIVRAMKHLAHPEQETVDALDVNRAVENALVVSRHEWSSVADVKTDLPEIPAVECQASSISQVLLNIVVNAAHAVGDRKARTGARGKISVRTSSDGSTVCVAIEDDGGGIPSAIREKIFDPFFTTKPVGQGTGQGLSIARAIVQRHGGTLTFDSRDGVGTTFFVRLPLVARLKLAKAA